MVDATTLRSVVESMMTQLLAGGETEMLWRSRRLWLQYDTPGCRRQADVNHHTAMRDPGVR